MMGAIPPPLPPGPLKSATIDDLLNKLQGLKAQRAELDRLEQELVAVLKEKLKEQKERLQKLGVTVEESPSPKAVPKHTGPKGP